MSTLLQSLPYKQQISNAFSTKGMMKYYFLVDFSSSINCHCLDHFSYTVKSVCTTTILGTAKQWPLFASGRCLKGGQFKLQKQEIGPKNCGHCRQVVAIRRIGHGCQLRFDCTVIMQQLLTKIKANGMSNKTIIFSFCNFLYKKIIFHT